MTNIPLQAEPVFHIGSLPITNAVVATWLVMLLLVGLAILARRSLVSGRGVGGAISLGLEGFAAFLEDLLGWSATRRLLPILGTFLLFILGGNWLGLLPGFGSIRIAAASSPVPLLRAATSDLHTTLALAIISIVAIQIWGMSQRGFRYLEKYVNWRGPLYLLPVNLFVGLLELVSEAAKILSFGFRLFGNIFAGEVLVSIMIGLIPLLVPSIFYGLEVFVGLIQAFVFVLLTAVFFKLAGEAHTDHAPAQPTN